MKLSTIVPFVGLSAAFFIPDEQVLSEIAIEDHRHSQESSWSKNVQQSFEGAISVAKNVLDDALAETSDARNTLSNKVYDTAFDIQSWLESALSNTFDSSEDHEHPPHHGGPGHDRPHPPHHPHDPHHPPHHSKPNQTVYELISKSKYTTKLAKLIDDYPDLVEALNGTKANYTVFAPTDKAFERIPGDHKPSKEDIKKILSYHVSPEFYPAKVVLRTHTIPTLLKGEHLPGKHSPQRLSINIGLRGLTVNFYSRVVAIDIFGTNGVIHAVDHIILPPPEILKIVSLLPSEFSTLELALAKTGLNTTDHPPGTLFAPSNFAFSRLGPRINAFLFSPRGLPYLEALLKYHMVPDHTLYSDAYYKSESDSEKMGSPNGVFHVDLPTALSDRYLSIDIAKYLGFIEMKINSFARVSVFDGVASNGVIQVVSSVLVPPKKLDARGSRLPQLDFWRDSDEMTLEDFTERFETYITTKIDL